MEFKVGDIVSFCGVHTEKAISAYNAGFFTKVNKHYVDLVLRQYVYFKIDRGI